MFAPTKIWRRWHRRINKNQRRFAVCAAIAATAEPSLVLARGHRVNAVPEIPLVVAAADVNSLSKTKDAVALLKRVGAYADIERVISSRHVRSGKGKMRNRRYVQRRGPLVVYQTEGTLVRAFRNIPGIDLVNVHKLNLLQLAPGGHLGRFVIWTEDAFKQLDHVFGSHAHESLEKSGYKPPRPIMANPDLGRIINSSSIQEVLRDTQKRRKFTPRKKNPLVNVGALVKLNPYALAQRRRALSLSKLGAKRAAQNLATRKAGKPTKASGARKTERQAAKAMAKKRSAIISLITGVKA
jgi:large subunit ribosomal protein L4e